MLLRFTTILSVAAAIALLLQGCGDDPPDPTPEVEEVPTPSVPETVMAGEIVYFPCQRDAVVLPLHGFSGQRAKIAITAGTYSWRCVNGDAEGVIQVTPAPFVGVVWGGLPPAVRVGESRVIAPRSADIFGNEANEPLDFDLSPAKRVHRTGNRVRFLGAGPVTVRAHRSGHALAQHVLTVDSGPPVVSILSPIRGTVVRRRLSPGVDISGVVREDGPGVALFVGGHPIPVRDDGFFATTIYPEGTGLHVITYRAIDATGQETRGSRAVLYGPLRDPRKGLETAARVHLPRWFLDDDEPDLDDLASAFKLLMSMIRVPDQRIRFGCNGHVNLKDISLRVSNIDFVPIDGGIELAVELSDVSVDLMGQGCGCAFGQSVGCVSADGRVQTDRVVVRLEAEVGQQSPTSLNIDNASVTLGALDIHWDFMWGGFDWLIEVFEPEIRSKVEESVEAAVTARAKANLGDILSAIVPVQTIDMPPPLHDVVAVESRLAAIDVTSSGVSVDVDTLALPNLGDGSPAELPGISRRTVRASGEPPTLPAHKIGIAVSLDVVNDAVYSLYARGTLDDLVIVFEDYGIPRPRGLIGPVFAQASLPPMLLPGPVSGQVSLVVGDLRVQVDTIVDTAALYVSFSVPGTLRFDEETHELVLELIDDGLEVYFEAASIEDAVTLSATFHDLENVVRRVVVGSVVGKAMRIPVPVLDLSKIKGLPGSPQLQLVDAEILVTDQGYVIATGRVKPTL